MDSLGLPGKEYGAIIRAAEVRVVVREPPTYASGRKRRESLSGSDKKWSVIHYDKGIYLFWVVNSYLLYYIRFKYNFECSGCLLLFVQLMAWRIQQA